MTTTVTPVGTEILVNTATDSSQDTSGSAVKAQIFAADGAPVGTEILVKIGDDDPLAGASIAKF